MTALNGAPWLGQDGESDMVGLPGLEMISEQLAARIAVLRAEQARRQAGMAVKRPAWKNLVFTGGPGTGKSRTARAVARVYRELGLLSSGRVDEVAAASMVGTSPRESGVLVGETVRRASGGILMIPDAHAWQRLPDRGQQVLRRLYQELTEWRDDLAVILAGHPGPLRDLLRASPPLAARFPAVIDFPGYTAGQLAAIFATLAGEAGFTLTADAARKATAVIAQAEGDHGPGNARLAVRLLDQVTASQARRVTTAVAQEPDPRTLSTIRAADIPGQIHPHDPPAEDRWPGQYL